MKHYILALLCLVSITGVFSQEEKKPWSLQQCIEYALQNNIQVGQNRLNAKLSEASLLQNKMQMLPSLNGSISNSYNSGQRVDPFTNQFVAGDWTQSQNYSLTANALLFGGFQVLNTIKQNKYDLQASEQDVLKIQNDISLNIASAYLQILFSQELLATSKSQADITKLQLDRTQKLVDVGNLPKGSLLDMQAQMASEDVNIVNAENNLSISKLNLIQMLNLDSADSFSIVVPEITMPAEAVINSTADQIYQAALAKQPEIKSSELKLMSSEKGVSIAQAGRYPRLSLNASYGTGYSGARKELVGTPIFKKFTPNGSITGSGDLVYEPTFDATYETTPLNTQLQNNINRSVGLFLNVPLFNNLQTSTAITRAKINRENAALSLQLQKDNLKKNIQQAYNNAYSSLKKYEASKKAVDAMEESFKYTEQKYNLVATNNT